MGELISGFPDFQDEALDNLDLGEGRVGDVGLGLHGLPSVVWVRGLFGFREGLVVEGHVWLMKKGIFACI